MANTYHQIYLQFVFAVRNRQSLIRKNTKEDLQKYITGLVENRKAKMLAVNCMPDHAHLFVGFHPNVLISNFIKEIKVESNEFMNTKMGMNYNFGWQNGYGVFSYSRSDIDSIVKYILNQDTHHKKKTFRMEYLELLEELQIPFEEHYLFDFFD